MRSMQWHFRSDQAFGLSSLPVLGSLVRLRHPLDVLSPARHDWEGCSFQETSYDFSVDFHGSSAGGDLDAHS